MKTTLRWPRHLFLLTPLLGAGLLPAATSITTFDNFTADVLYGGWAAPTATIVSGATAYAITAASSGSAYKYLGDIAAPGATTLELELLLEGSPAADGALSPMLSLGDADGTQVTYVWPAQSLGPHLLTLPVNAPTWVLAAGSVPGLDLANLRHLQFQIDSGELGPIDRYTATWQNLRLTTPMVITHCAFAPATRLFSLTWSSATNKTYTVLHAATATGIYTPLANNVPSGGLTTTRTVTMPAANSGFLRVEEQATP